MPFVSNARSLRDAFERACLCEENRRLANGGDLSRKALVAIEADNMRKSRVLVS